jgi:hypothetical protein
MAENYLVNIFCGECFSLSFPAKNISLCEILSLPLLLKLINLFLLGFGHSKSKNSSLRKKSQSSLVLIGLFDTICALCPIVFLRPSLYQTKFPYLHLFDAILSISATLIQKDLLRSKQLSCSGLCSSLVTSLLLSPLYIYLLIAFLPNLTQSSWLYLQSIVIASLVRTIFSLLWSGIFSYHLLHLIDPIDESGWGNYRSLSNASSSNNIPLVDLDLDLDLGLAHTISWESFSTNVEISREGEGPTSAAAVEEDKYENYYQALFLSSISTMFTKASRSEFKGLQDMPPLPHDIHCHDQIASLSATLHNRFCPPSSHVSPPPSSSSAFFLLLVTQYSSDFLFTALLVFFKSTLQFIGPIMLQQLVLSAQHHSSWSQILGQIFILFFSRFLCSFLDTHYHLSSQLLALKISGALKGTFFSKLISLSSTSRMSYTIGNITNLYTVDIDRIVDVLKDIHNFWALPLQVQ